MVNIYCGIKVYIFYLLTYQISILIDISIVNIVSISYRYLIEDEIVISKPH